MAELLVFTRNNTHADFIVDRTGCYKSGHIVVVQADGFAWGKNESKAAWVAAGNTAATFPGDFVVVKIPGVAVQTVQDIISCQTADDAGVPVVDADGRPKVFRRRGWQLVINSIPTAIKNALLANGEITVTPSQIRNYIQRVRDNAVYSSI